MVESMDPAVRRDVAHLLRRAGFGGRPAEVDAAAEAGYEATVDALLAGLDRPDAAGDAVGVPAFAPVDGRDGRGDQAARAAMNRQRQAEARQLVGWWVARMTATDTPLREKLTLFWHGHFATSVEKVRFAELMLRQNELLRRAGAGNFEALTAAIATDPAMMVWLDAASNKKAHPNENFARELMELFTLGVGNYSETDVREAARCFTGWRLDRGDGGSFALDPRQHDDGTKTVLGQTGPFGGDDVVRIVTHHPAGAPFVVAKIWSHFATPVAPDDPVVADLAPAFARDLDVRTLLRHMFLHPAFRADATRAGLVKTPVEYVVGTLRVTGVPVPDDSALAGPGLLDALGQVPFRPPSVAGWPQNRYWLSTATSLARLRFAEQVAAAAAKADAGGLASTPPAGRVDAVAHLLSVEWVPPTASALAGVADDPKLLLTMALVSPEWVLA